MKPRWNKGALRHLATQNRGRSIGLYGGSFNPAHPGHLYVAHEALKRLKLDEIWFLVSPGNPLKPQKGMAPFDARLASVNSLIAHHSKMAASDIEMKLGTRYTADTICALKNELPHTNFVWLMGADNLAAFDRWYKWQEIAKSLPIAIFDRTGYAVHGFASSFARHFAKHQTSARTFDATQIPNWTFVTLPRHPASATDIRDQHGENWFLD